MNKLLSLILLLSLSLAFYSCGSDDDDEPEKFVWGGDWNDPDDPNYKPEYEGKYNPIQGLWRSDVDNRYGAYFTEDLIYYTIYFYPNGGYIKGDAPQKYQINDKAYRFSWAAPDTYRYKMVNGKFYMTSDKTIDNYGGYTRVQEEE